MAEYNFERFDAFGGRVVPTINLNSYGFSLSSGFTKKYRFENNVWVRLFYDKAKHAVAFTFYPVERNGTIKLKIAPKSSGASIKSKAFLIQYGIDPKRYRGKYTSKEVVHAVYGRMHVIDLVENKKKK